MVQIPRKGKLKIPGSCAFSRRSEIGAVGCGREWEEEKTGESDIRGREPADSLEASVLHCLASDSARLSACSSAEMSAYAVASQLHFSILCRDCAHAVDSLLTHIVPTQQR